MKLLNRCQSTKSSSCLSGRGGRFFLFSQTNAQPILRKIGNRATGPGK